MVGAQFAPRYMGGASDGSDQFDHVILSAFLFLLTVSFKSSSKSSSNGTSGITTYIAPDKATRLELSHFRDSHSDTYGSARIHAILSHPNFITATLLVFF